MFFYGAFIVDVGYTVHSILEAAGSLSLILRLGRQSAAFWLLRLLKWFACHSSHQASDAMLELSVLGGVDQRVDAAVNEH